MTRTYQDRVAAVTGAGSGIGKQLALGLARRGAMLAIADVDERGLAETEGQVRSEGADVLAAVVDVAERDQVESFARMTVERFGRANLVFNNAGISGDGSSVLDIEQRTFERVLAVNLWGVVNGTTAFLPHLLAAGDGHVVNISSLNGFMAQPQLSAYCTSKFAVRGFTESLRAEMLAAGAPVRVTVVHPGGVATNIATAALEEAMGMGREVTPEQEARVRHYNEKLLRMAPETAARIILDGVAAGKARILVGRDARLVDLAVRAMPSGYVRIIAALARRASAQVVGLPGRVN